MNPLIRKTFTVPLDDDAVLDIAARNGFQVARPPAPPAPAESPLLRRKPPPNRHFQLNVRLRKDTVEYIYAQADARGIVVAAVLEDMVDVYARYLAGKP